MRIVEECLVRQCDLTLSAVKIAKDLGKCLACVHALFPVPASNRDLKACICVKSLRGARGRRRRTCSDFTCRRCRVHAHPRAKHLRHLETIGSDLFLAPCKNGTTMQPCSTHHCKLGFNEWTPPSQQSPLPTLPRSLVASDPGLHALPAWRGRPDHFFSVLKAKRTSQ